MIGRVPLERVILNTLMACPQNVDAQARAVAGLFTPEMWSDANEWHCACNPDGRCSFHGGLPQEADVVLYGLALGSED